MKNQISLFTTIIKGEGDWLRKLLALIITIQISIFIITGIAICIKIFISIF